MSEKRVVSKGRVAKERVPKERVMEVECPDCGTKQEVRAPTDARHFLYFLNRWAHPSGRKSGCLDGCVHGRSPKR